MAARAIVGTVVDLNELVADLRAEGDALDALVADLSPDGWARPTPAAGWTVAHQVAHLAWTDERAQLAIDDKDAFQAEFTSYADRAGAALDKVVDEEAARLATRPDLLVWWRAGRR